MMFVTKVVPGVPASTARTCELVALSLHRQQPPSLLLSSPHARSPCSVQVRRLWLVPSRTRLMTHFLLSNGPEIVSEMSGVFLR